ncbi:hypothetical protein JAAARDRAFT_134111 [Jaapia argillacea MUCL 33604]|uniref:Uncharacterized protein n=1 Tax=Jaapia argillacea MUCL 33604 TaxID=933084 RepID=A0A067PN77_9AGAM|nr:hypothetical protein JAAARDRAFT_134111 [Jaapia argillacea MUCL 33604]
MSDVQGPANGGKKPGRYREALRALSARTGTPLPSLVFSFVVLHELTAIASMVGLFYGARALSLGETLVDLARKDSDPLPGDAQDSWVKEKWRTWVDEGEKKAERVGRRYGWFGFEKGSNPAASEEIEGQLRSQMSKRIAGDVANAVVAYGITKALMPIRLPLSMYLSPAFSRRVVDPVRRTFLRPFLRTRPPGQ